MNPFIQLMSADTRPSQQKFCASDLVLFPQEEQTKTTKLVVQAFHPSVLELYPIHVDK